MANTDFVVPETNSREDIMEESIRILKQESKLFKNNSWCIPEIFHGPNSTYWPTIEKLYGMTYQILEYGHSSLVPRSYNNIYNLTEDKIAYESVGAHTNFMKNIVDLVIKLGWGSAIYETVEGYHYCEIMEAISRHDLPENVIGDIPDNGDRDEAAKSKKEHEFWQDFRKYSFFNEFRYEDRIQNLLDEMEQKSTIIGRILYLADKIAADLITLCYDAIGTPPMMSIDSDKVSVFDLDAMMHCDYRDGGYRKASEMWTYSYFENRGNIKYDDTGFFTAIIVIATLMVNGKWYNWRESKYTHS